MSAQWPASTGTLSRGPAAARELAAHGVAAWILAPAWRRRLLRKRWPELALPLDVAAQALDAARAPHSRWRPGA